MVLNLAAHNTLNRTTTTTTPSRRCRYQDVGIIHELQGRVSATKASMRTQLLQELKDYLPSSPLLEEKETRVKLHNACLVLHVLGVGARKDLVEWFVAKLLEEYEGLFAPGGEGGTLEQTDRRYAWLRRALGSFSDK